MIDYERKARHMDQFADFLAGHFRAVQFAPAHCDVESVMNQYAILVQRHDGPCPETTERLTSRGMAVYDQETADREQARD